MANDITNIKSRGGLIASDAAGFLSDHMQFIKSIDKADASTFNSVNGYKPGDTVKINVPAQFTVGTSADITSSIEDVEEGSVDLTVNNQSVVSVAFTSSEFATDEEYSRWRTAVLEPAMINLSTSIESSVLATASDAVYNAVGTAGTTTFDTNTILQAGEKLDISGCKDYDNRFVLLNPAANRSAVNERKGLFQSSEEISKQYKSGAMGMADGFTFLRNNLLNTHTNGNDVVFEVRTTVSTEGSTSLVVEGLTSTTGTVTKGTVFTVAGVYKVHPNTKATLPDLQQFVVTADATADASGYATLSVSPAMYTSASSAKQNISGFPQDGDAITPIGSASTGYAQNMAYHKSAFRFCSLPLIKPNGVNMVGQETQDGLTVRVVEDYDPLKDRMVMRFDVLWGLAIPRAEWACRIYS